MASTSAMIHMIAALLVAGMAYLLLVRQKQRDLLRLCLGGSKQAGVRLACPWGFWEQLAQALGVPERGLHKLGKTGKPQMLKISILRDFLKQARIVSLCGLDHSVLASPGSGEACLEVRVEATSEAAREWSPRLTQAFGVKIKVVAISKKDLESR